MRIGTDLWNQFETMFNKEDFVGVDALFARDAIYVEPTGRHEGVDAIRSWLDESVQTFSHVDFKASLVIEQGATVVAEWSYRCTNSGPVNMPDGSVIPATGKALDTPGVTIFEFKDGRIAAARDYFDLLAGMSQLGLMPSTFRQEPLGPRTD